MSEMRERGQSRMIRWIPGFHLGSSKTEVIENMGKYGDIGIKMTNFLYKMANVVFVVSLEDLHEGVS